MTCNISHSEKQIILKKAPKTFVRFCEYLFLKLDESDLLERLAGHLDEKTVHRKDTPMLNGKVYGVKSKDGSKSIIHKLFLKSIYYDEKYVDKGRWSKYEYSIGGEKYHLNVECSYNVTANRNTNHVYCSDIKVLLKEYFPEYEIVDSQGNYKFGLIGENSINEKRFLFKKAVDVSVFRHGITIPKSVHDVIYEHIDNKLAKDAPNGTIHVNVEIEGETIETSLMKAGADCIQIRYTSGLNVSKKMMEMFPSSYAIVQKQEADGEKTPTIPKGKKEYFNFYLGKNKREFYIEKHIEATATDEPQHWIISGNLNIYNVIDAFRELKQVDWNWSPKKANVGDIVYVYLSKPGHRIVFKARIVELNVPYDKTIEDSKFVVDASHLTKSDSYTRLELVEEETTESITIDQLRAHGLKCNIQGPLKAETETWQYIESVFNGEMPTEDDDFEYKTFNLSALPADIAKSGLIYSDDLLYRYAISLLTKPFVILSGLAGSGKTQLAIAFAKWLCADADDQMKLVAVGADWNNRENLLGYVNALEHEKYVSPENETLEFILKAKANPTKPYFLILDEMNLSYVERYFADFLSAMESKQSIHLHPGKGNWGDIPTDVQMPKNLFITGTINVDETTYMFSPKVLDRANVIEFRVDHDDLASFFEREDIEPEDYEGLGKDAQADFVRLAQAKYGISSAKDIQDTLLSIFDHLKFAGAEFGFRTASEIAKFVGIAHKLQEDWKDEERWSNNKLIDIVTMQKLLPKLHGSRKKLSKILEALWSLCFTTTDGVNIPQIGGDDAITNCKYMLTASKLRNMYKNANDNGFTSYAEA